MVEMSCCDKKSDGDCLLGLCVNCLVEVVDVTCQMFLQNVCGGTMTKGRNCAWCRGRREIKYGRRGYGWVEKCI